MVCSVSFHMLHECRPISLAEETSLLSAVQASIAEAAFMTGMERYSLLLYRHSTTATPVTHVQALAVFMHSMQSKF